MRRPVRKHRGTTKEFEYLATQTRKLQEKVKGFVRPVDMETKKRLEESEVLQDEGIELWNSDGSLKQITSEETSEKAFPKYLQTLAEIEDAERADFLAAEGNKNQD